MECHACVRRIQNLNDIALEIVNKRLRAPVHLFPVTLETDCKRMNQTSFYFNESKHLLAAMQF